MSGGDGEQLAECGDYDVVLNPWYELWLFHTVPVFPVTDAFANGWELGEQVLTDN